MSVKSFVTLVPVAIHAVLLSKLERMAVALGKLARFFWKKFGKKSGRKLVCFLMESKHF
jgi:hypothetical protein